MIYLFDYDLFSGYEKRAANDLGPTDLSATFKKECKSNDRLIHFVECSNVQSGCRGSNTIMVHRWLLSLRPPWSVIIIIIINFFFVG